MHHEVQIITERGETISALLTTERAESSYGLPVVVVEGEALGTADIAVRYGAGVRLSGREEIIRAAERAGYQVLRCRRMADGTLEHRDGCEMVSSRVPPYECTAWPCGWIETSPGEWSAEHNPDCQLAGGAAPCVLPTTWPAQERMLEPEEEDDPHA